MGWGKGRISSGGLVVGFVVLLSLFFLPPRISRAFDGNPPEKTLSPYFFVKSDEDSLAQLPLKSTSAEVNIAGIVADVKIRQVYRNTGKKPIEAVYIFPWFHARRGPRHADDDRRQGSRCEDQGEGDREGGIRAGEEGGEKRLSSSSSIVPTSSR